MRKSWGENVYTVGGSPGTVSRPRSLKLPPLNTDGNRNRDRYHDHDGNHESDHRFASFPPGQGFHGLLKTARGASGTAVRPFCWSHA
jgi:hypothetical protein